MNKGCQTQRGRGAKQKAKGWQLLRESNPSFQIENYAETLVEQDVRQNEGGNLALTTSTAYEAPAKPAPFSFDDLRLDEFLALKRDGHFTIRGNVLTIRRKGCPDERIMCFSPGEANRLRLALAEGLAGHIE